jgi:hypothetical protein
VCWVLGAAASDWLAASSVLDFTVAFVVFSEEEEERGPTVRNLRIKQRFSEEEERGPTVRRI